MDTISHTLQDQISELLKPHRICLVMPVLLHQSGGKSANKFVVLSLWRGYLISNKQPLRVESTFSYLEISSINIHSLTQIVLETDRHSLSFSVLHEEDLEAMISHMTASLKRIFPDSSPGKLLKTIPQDLQERLITLTGVIGEQLNSQPGPCGGFSDTYAALCDFNEIPFREEIQWDVDNIYYIHNWNTFNLLDFSHLDSRDLALVVAALSFNQWFTTIYCKELKLSIDIQQQLMFLLSKSPCLQELSLENCGLKVDFAIKMTTALQDHTRSPLQSINLSGNPIEDKGVIALSQELQHLEAGLKHLSLRSVSMTAKGLGCLSQVLSSNQQFSSSLTHLDLSGNPGSLVTEEATFLFKFLSNTNSLSYLDLSDTSCPLDTLFVSLSAGCCFKLIHLNLARNPFSYRKVREVTRSVQEFFSHSCELKYVGLSATKLPPQALRLLLQGLATNTHLFGLELDLSSCELRSAGAQVIQEHISEATAIKRLDISDNNFENNMVTLVLTVGRCPSLHHLALGRNFAMKSRALTDLLHRIAQLIQDEECPLQSLSVCDSKLKAGMHILLSALGGNAALVELDISGNNIGDTGAKMLAKALMTNTSLRSLSWDRNNVTSRGYQDVADALNRNFTLQKVPLPLADVAQSYRSNPDRTKEALHKIQQCLDRNNQRQPSILEHQQVLRSQQSEKLVQGLCRQLEDSLQRLSHCNYQADIVTAHQVLQNARESLKLLPSLCEESKNCSSNGDWVNIILSDTAAALTQEVTRSLQELSQGLMIYAEAVCPRVVQCSSVCKCLSECVSKRSRQAEIFLRSTLVETTGQIISTRLCEMRQTLTVALTESIVQQMLQDLTTAQEKMDFLIKENSSTRQRINIPELRLVDEDFPTDDYSPALWRNDLLSKSLRPAASIKSLLDADCEPQIRERRVERPRGGAAAEDDRGGRCVLPQSPTATSLPLTTSSSTPSPSTSLAPSPQVQRRRRVEEEVVSVDAAEARSEDRGASFKPPPSLPPIYSFPVWASKEEEVAGCEGLVLSCSSYPGPPFSSESSDSPMEPLPTQGQTLRHYTASRPQPRRKHKQPPSARPQEPVLEEKNEATETMGRVDEGVEEFFTKKIIPDYAPKSWWEDSNPVQATPPESSSTPSTTTSFPSSSDISTPSTTTTVTPPCFSSDVLCPSPDVSPLCATSINTIFTCVTTTTTTTTNPSKNIKKKFGDFFAFKRARAGRAAKAGGGEEGGAEWVKVKKSSIADLIRPLREGKERERKRESGGGSEEEANICNDSTATEGTVTDAPHLAGSVRETTPLEISLTITTSPDLVSSFQPKLEDAAVPVLPGCRLSPEVVSSLTEQEMQSGGTPYGEKRQRMTKRLRDAKCQSLILLTGSEAEDKDNTPSKNKDEELRKANSEGSILDKPARPPPNIKPRTMSTSSDDPRLLLRPQDPTRPETLLHPKPLFPDRIIGPLPPKPTIAAKPPAPSPRPSSAPVSSSLIDQIQITGRAETAVQNGSQDSMQGAVLTLSPRKELLSSASAPWRGVSTQDHSKKSPSLTEESLPRTRQHMKPLPQHRAVSVHEDTMAMTQELKTVLQRSPIRFRGNKWDLPSCNEDKAQRTDVGGIRKQSVEEMKDTGQLEEPKADKGTRGFAGKVAEAKYSVPGKEVPHSTCPQAKHESTATRTIISKAVSTLERPPELTQTTRKSPVMFASDRKSSSTNPQTLTKLQVSPTGQENISSTAPVATKSTEIPHSAAVDHGHSTKETREVLSEQHTKLSELAEHRAESPPSE
ncbi:capping protein, Arp2/3 and myosin-I linker protein 2 isoform X2 [Kryptolebias marmoratus]|nr:capping protein, Arp2/3 and myosin-I linker protein 2 isoform X2 [Kryptolebias marmoratus]